MSNQNLSGSVLTTVELIRKFTAAIESTKKKYADNPVYLQSSISRAEKQIAKLYKDLKFLLGLPEEQSFEDSLSGTVVLYGNEGSDAYVTAKSLNGFLNRLRASIKAFLPDDDLDFLIRAAGTGSIHLSFEPTGKDKDKGLKALQAIGETACRLSAKKSLRKNELSEFELAIARLMPKERIGIQRMEFKGRVLSPKPLSISKNDVKVKSSRQARELPDKQISFSGKIVDVNLEKMGAVIKGINGSKRQFFFEEVDANKVIDGLKNKFSVVHLKKEVNKMKLKNIETMDNSNLGQ